jgi:alanine racemase
LLCLPDLQEFPAKHDHAGMTMKIYKMKSFTKQITVEVIQQTIKKMNNMIEELREMNLQNLTQEKKLKIFLKIHVKWAR